MLAMVGVLFGVIALAYLGFAFVFGTIREWWMIGACSGCAVIYAAFGGWLVMIR